MKKTALVVFLVLCMALTVLLSSCFDEESYYTKTDTESLVKTLEEALTEKVNANEAAIKALKTEYEAKIKALEDEDAILTADLAALKTAHEQKVAELDAANDATQGELDELETQYAADLAALKKADADNDTAIKALKTAHEQKVAELDAANKATQSELDAFEEKYATDLTALEKADADNDAEIKALKTAHEQKVAELVAANKATQSELDALETAYNTSVTEINRKLAANETAISNAKTELQNKLDTLAADHDSEIASITALITALQNADTANEARIAALEQQVNAILSQHKHTFGDWVHFSGNENVYCENRLFYRICSQCRVLEWKQGSDDDHTFTTVTTPPTCQAGGFDTNTCTTCGKVEVTNHTDKVSHIYKTTYSHDGSYHWYDCQHCDATKDKAEHNLDLTTGYCTVCDQPIAGSEGILYNLSADGTYAEVIGYEGTATKIVIADTYNGKPVAAIYKEAFKNNNSITSVLIPASVTSIGEYAFDFCYNLTSVHITDLAAWCQIKFANYYNASPLQDGAKLYLNGSELSGNIVIPEGVTKISISAFYRCKQITSITIPASVTSIGECAFSDCSGLTSVTFEEGSQIKSIHTSAFDNCSKLQYTQYGNCKYLGTATNPYFVLVCITSTAFSSYTIHEQARVIANESFYGCERLQSITLPASVTSIGYEAFHDCSGLASINIPARVTSIGYEAFRGCSSLTSVTFENTTGWWRSTSSTATSGKVFEIYLLRLLLET